MRRIAPVWILTSLTGEAFDKFKEAIDQQFRAFSETELNGFVDCATHQWWGVETTDGGLDGKWDDNTGYPNGIPAYNLKGQVDADGNQLIDGECGIVIYYSPLKDFTNESGSISYLNRNQLFLQTYGGNRFFYGLTSFQKRETAGSDFLDRVRTIQDEETRSKLFSSVTLLSNSSHKAGENPNGYQSLDDDDFRALVVNTIFTIAITKTKLHQLNNNQNRLFNTAGVFSFTYEPDALKKKKAYHLAEELLESFCNNKKDAEWYSENGAKEHFDGSSLKKNLHWYNIYKLFSQGFKEESLKGLYTECEISPWRMFAYKLVPFYFKRHIKSLLRKTYDKVHNFASLTTMRYESFAIKRRKNMLEGTAEIEDKQQFAKTAIANYLSSVWSPNNDSNRKTEAKGVRQVLYLLEKKVIEYFNEQKAELSRIKAFTEPNDDKHKKFPEMEDFPLKDIFKKENEKYQKKYKEFVTNGEPPAEHTEEADKSYEERQLNKLHNLLKWHAMPLNLFTKAALLSALIFVTVWAGISIIQATTVDKIQIFSLDTSRSLVALGIVTAIIVLTFAFVKYGIKTLRKIRLAIRDYIVWSYYRVQREVYGITIKEEINYYDELIKECDRIKKQLEDFVASEVKEKPSFGKYRESKFQRNILGKMDNSNQILANTALNVTLSVNGKNFSPDEVVQGLFAAMLNDGNQQLGEQMRTCVLLGTDDDKDNNLKDKLLGLWTDSLADKIQVLINGHYGQSVDFPAFHNAPMRQEEAATRGTLIGANFTTGAWQSANAIIYPSVYVNSMIPHSYSISVVPHGDGYHPGDQWENLFYGPTGVNEKVPNYANVRNQPGWFATRQIAAFMRIHAYNRLIVKDRNDEETTIFNN